MITNHISPAGEPSVDEETLTNETIRRTSRNIVSIIFTYEEFSAFLLEEISNSRADQPTFKPFSINGRVNQFFCKYRESEPFITSVPVDPEQEEDFRKLIDLVKPLIN